MNQALGKSDKTVQRMIEASLEEADEPVRSETRNLKNCSKGSNLVN
jgi:hypothetical protein